MGRRPDTPSAKENRMQPHASLIQTLLDLFFHLDAHLNQWATMMGSWLYLLLFAIIFGETGLVVTPFLPGDSLLFAVGALAALEGSPLQVGWLLFLLALAGLVGNWVNYAIGYKVGPRVFASEKSKLFNKAYLFKAQAFYEKYGGRAIVLARFVPIIRTFAPFVAGIGSMTYMHFIIYNIAGGVLWILMFVLGGYFFGNIPLVKGNFTIVIGAIIIISIMPGVIEYLRQRGKTVE